MPADYRGKGRCCKFAGLPSLAANLPRKVVITLDRYALHNTYYEMIRSFADRTIERFFRDGVCPARWRPFESAAVRKLDMVDAAVRLDDLLSPPGNQLEALKGNRKGQFSIRINRQWRARFRWTPDGAEGVEIVDYH